MFQDFAVSLNKRDVVLNDMQSSTHVFHLTGSRLFGNHRDDSDYDFFVMENPGLVSELHVRGFKKISRTGCRYNDPSVVFIYRHDCGIDVQIIKPEYFMAKRKVNQFLNSGIGRQLLGRHHSKPDRINLWSFLITLTM